MKNQNGGGLFSKYMCYFVNPSTLSGSELTDLWDFGEQRKRTPLKMKESDINTLFHGLSYCIEVETNLLKLVLDDKQEKPENLHNDIIKLSELRDFSVGSETFRKIPSQIDLEGRFRPDVETIRNIMRQLNNIDFFARKGRTPDYFCLGFRIEINKMGSNILNSSVHLKNSLYEGGRQKLKSKKSKKIKSKSRKYIKKSYKRSNKKN